MRNRKEEESKQPLLNPSSSESASSWDFEKNKKQTSSKEKEKENGQQQLFFPQNRFTTWSEFFSSVSSLVKFEFLLHLLAAIYAVVAFVYGQNLVASNLEKYSNGNETVEKELRRHLQPPRFYASFISSGYDVSDDQWRKFEYGIPLMLLVFGSYVCIGRFCRHVLQVSKNTLFRLYCVMSLSFIFYVYQWGCIPLFSIFVFHFIFTKYGGQLLPRWLFLSVMWTYLTALMISNEWTHGYIEFFETQFPSLMKQLREPLMDWYLILNMQLLRLIAYSIDYLEACDNGEQRAKEVTAKHRTQCPTCGQLAAKWNSEGKIVPSEIQPLCYKARTDTPRPLDEYTFVNFLAYMTYLPLFIGGPISSFNSFASHISIPTKVMNMKDMIRYGFRTFGNYFVLVLLLHFSYHNAVRLQPDLLHSIPIFDQTGVLYLMLAFLWLKFNVLWKFFRLFGIIDGVEAPENMNRCFSNTVRVAEFWRDWHSSFNLWIIRYMYIPLGGSKHKVLVIFPIFFFIAVWHDSKMELLSWALIMSINFALELTLTSVCSKITFWKTLPFYRQLVALGGVWTVASLILANAFGFGTGMASKHIVEHSAYEGLSHTCLVWFCGIFAAANIGLIDREMEKNRKQKESDELKASFEIYGSDIDIASPIPRTPAVFKVDF